MAALISFAFALVAAVVLLVAPTGSSTSSTSVEGGPTTTRTEHVSLLDENGSSVILVLAVPVVLTAIGWAAAARGRARACSTVAVLMGVCVVLGLMSVGVFFVPAALAMVVAAASVRH